MPRSVRDIDRGYKRFQKQMREYRHGPSVTIGIQATDAQRGTEEGADFADSNVRLAAVHEFGSRDGRIPQRSFMRAPMDRERAKFKRMLNRAVRSAAINGDAKRQLGIIGEVARAEMIRTIDMSIGLLPLKSKTIERKGSTKPLIDTGQLKAAITWKVHMR